jgi:autotransporter-associated beta strand protein
VTVLAGTLKVDNNSALGNATGKTVVSNGATLDLGGPGFGVNAVNLISEVIMVSGTGVGGQGAIINSGSVAQDNALHTVVLTGHTTFGGPGNAAGGGNTPGRWDIRDTGGPASLITSNQPFNLTKVGGNQVSLVNAAVDVALANIEVQEGVLGVQGSTTLGNPTNTLTIFSNALLHLTGFAAVPSKIVVLKDGARVDSTSANNTFGGPFILQGSNAFIITAASLTLTNVISGPGALYKQGGSTLVLRGANTYSGGTVVSAGTLVLTNLGSIAGSSNVTIAAGATLNVQARSDGTLTLASGQTLAGNGTVLGSVTVAPGAQLSPGASIGALTITNVALLRGTTVMELNKATGTNDVLRGAATISYGGTLRLVNLGSPVVAGDSFKLFYATAYSGTFTNISPAIPALNLAWNTNTLAIDGTLRISSAPTPQPQITTIALSGANSVLSGTNGVPDWPYYLVSTTNIAAPIATWTRMATNQFDASGAFAITNPINPATPRQFFLLQMQ